MNPDAQLDIFGGKKRTPRAAKPVAPDHLTAAKSAYEAALDPKVSEADLHAKVNDLAKLPKAQLIEALEAIGPGFSRGVKSQEHAARVLKDVIIGRRGTEQRAKI